MSQTDENKKTDENHEFKINDRRRFQADGSAKAEEETRESAASAPRDAERAGSYEAVLPADFSSLLLSLAASAQMALGISPHPLTGKLEKSLLQAKHAIDMLSVLDEKTKGNLSGEEDKLLQALLYDLRIQYVEISKADKNEKK